MTLAPPTPVKTQVTRADHGRRMTLQEFENAEFEEGVRIELSRGVVDVHQESEGGIVSDIPGITHAYVEEIVRDAIAYYKRHLPGVVRHVATGMGSKVVTPLVASDRHPDVAIYLTDPPAGEQPWAHWLPNILVEIVSESSRRRDYVEKVADYWEAGIREYWIIDPQSAQVQICRRADDGWAITVLRAAQVLTSGLLPGFSLTIDQILASPTA